MATPADTSVFDIDGVVADVRHRLHHVQHRPKSWNAFFAAAPADPLLPAGAAAVAAAAALGRRVVFLTGRPEQYRRPTTDWLESHGLPAAELIMRPPHDRRPARLFKVEALRRLTASGAVVVQFVDDDESVVRAVRALGIEPTLADWLGEQPALWDAQEGEGRT